MHTCRVDQGEGVPPVQQCWYAVGVGRDTDNGVRARARVCKCLREGVCLNVARIGTYLF